MVTLPSDYIRVHTHYISHRCDQTLDEEWLKEEWVYCSSHFDDQSNMAQTERQQELEAAGQTVPTGKKKKKNMKQ